MEFYISRHPIFNRRKEVCGYRLQICPRLREYFYAHYREPDDAEDLYRRLCFAGFDGSPPNPMAVMDFCDEMLDSLVPLLPRNRVVVEYPGGGGELEDLKNVRLMRAMGYRVVLDGAGDISRKLFDQADIIRTAFPALAPEQHRAHLRKFGGRVRFLASEVETWPDFYSALDCGYDYFEGKFYLRPFPGRQGDIRSTGEALLRVMSEVNSPEPSFREITNIIEHDLNLSYSLLKLANSAYIGPRFKVKTISQAVTIIGLTELGRFVSALLLRGMKNPDNVELLRTSLIRGKLMDLIAGQKKISQKGSEAFFTGVFSLLDVILGRDMEGIVCELPLTDAVKEALTGGGNNLGRMLELVKAYEQAQWDAIVGEYRLDVIEQEKLMVSYLSALKWAESIDY